MRDQGDDTSAGIDEAAQLARKDAERWWNHTPKDGIWARCYWCKGEIYGPAVISYSEGISDCHQCKRQLPQHKVTYVPEHER